MDKRPIFESRDFVVYIEEFNGSNWAHCDVLRWSPAVARNMVDWADNIFEGYEPVLALHEQDQGKKHEKFLNLMGFEPYQQAVAYSGDPVTIYRR